MESVADALVDKVRSEVAALTVGPPEDNCDITPPVISESSANFIEGLVMDAKDKEATLCQKYRREGNLLAVVAGSREAGHEDRVEGTLRTCPAHRKDSLRGTRNPSLQRQQLWAPGSYNRCSVK